MARESLCPVCGYWHSKADEPRDQKGHHKECGMNERTNKNWKAGPDYKIRTWVTEFGSEYNVPEGIQMLAAQGMIQDTSWHNDASPSFELEVRGKRFRVWVEHEDPQMREDPDSVRYLAMVQTDEEGQEHDLMLETERTDEILSWLSKALQGCFNV